MATQLPFIPSEFYYRVSSVLEGVEYLFDVRWNARDAAWYLSLFDSEENPIVEGKKIVLGSWIGGRSVNPDFPLGAIVASDLSGSGVDAGFDDLGVRVVVYFYPASELLA